jgi:hypothetical protein
MLANSNYVLSLKYNAVKILNSLYKNLATRTSNIKSVVPQRLEGYKGEWKTSKFKWICHGWKACLENDRFFPFVRQTPAVG